MLSKIVLLAVLSVGLPAAAGQVVERVVAVVNDDIILKTELEQLAGTEYRGPDLSTPEGKREWADTKRKALDQIVDSKLMEQQARELKLAVSPEEIDRAVQQVKDQNHLDDATFTDALKQQGLTMAGYRKMLREQILRLKVINTAVRARVSVGDDEVRAFYQQNARQMSGDRQAHLRQILIALPEGATPAEVEAKKQVATKVTELARGGTQFAELAKQYSDDEATKEAGGDLGYIGKGVLVESLDDAVAAMEPGDIRGPLRTDRGWVVLQLVDRKSGDVRPFDEVKEQIRRQLYDEQVQKAQASWLKELRKKSHVDIRY